MVALPDLWAPVFSVHETVAEPGPEPLAGETVIQEPLPDVSTHHRHSSRADP